MVSFSSSTHSERRLECRMESRREGRGADKGSSRGNVARLVEMFSPAEVGQLRDPNGITEDRADEN